MDGWSQGCHVLHIETLLKLGCCDLYSQFGIFLLSSANAEFIIFIPVYVYLHVCVSHWWGRQLLCSSAYIYIMQWFLRWLLNLSIYLGNLSHSVSQLFTLSVCLLVIQCILSICLSLSIYLSVCFSVCLSSDLSKHPLNCSNVITLW